MTQDYEALLERLPPLRGARGCTTEALDEWERICGWPLPPSYREFVQHYGGASFEGFVAFEYGKRAEGSVRDWLQIMEPNMSIDEKAALEFDVEEHTDTLREFMTDEAGEAGKLWAPALVPLAVPMNGHGWLAFDFSDDAQNPPVVMYDDQIAWEAHPRHVISFVAADFVAFMRSLYLPTLETEYRDFPPPPLTLEQTAWFAHVDNMLGIS